MSKDRINQIRELLQQSAHTPEKQKVFFKTGVGNYAEHDQFMGVSVPNVRKIAKEFSDLSLAEIQVLIRSPFNEERLLALIILVYQYQKVAEDHKQELFQFYLDNLEFVNNWNLVDSSAHLILGAHLFEKNRKQLLTLAKSKILWDRRIAIVATWYFIRKNDLEWTFKLAKIMLNDKHDLIHKAVGWMLREAGQRDQAQLISFLNQHASKMPRTMLRYAIEKFPEAQRKKFLHSTKL